MRYLAGPSRLWLPGHPDGIEPGSTFEHVFDGTDGFGPDQEVMLMASGALTRVDESPKTASAGVAPVVSTDNQSGNTSPHQE